MYFSRQTLVALTVISITILPGSTALISPSSRKIASPPSLSFIHATANKYNAPSFILESSRRRTFLRNSLLDDDDDDEDDDEEDDLYRELASSEFTADSSSSLTTTENSGGSDIDWGGELGSLRKRIGDIETGKSGPSQALFRIMTRDTPNEAISSFVSEANPEVVQAMSGAVNALLGGLSSPVVGVETVVKASGEKMGNLCFQLQMTGYMFRNAEYVIALKNLLNIEGGATLPEYKKAFDRMDNDGSGFIETSEVEALLTDVYEGKAPKFEVMTFMKFFDTNKDGRVSWKEFEQGLGAMKAEEAAERVNKLSTLSLPGVEAIDDDDEDDGYSDRDVEPSVSGTIEVEIENGKFIKVDAKDYIRELKKEAEDLKDALLREKGIDPDANPSGTAVPPGMMGLDPSEETGIVTYIASLQGDVKALTTGISPEVMETMKKLVGYVVDGGPSGKKVEGDWKERQMEIPGGALKQLALWQLVLGYRLREAEATGDYKTIADS